MTKTNHLQSYDLLMTVAITAMLIDHIGYFFIDNDILRIIGRLAAPLFLFLAGYGNNHIKPAYLFWGIVLTYLHLTYTHDEGSDILITFFMLSVTYQYVLRHLPNLAIFPIITTFSITVFIALILAKDAHHDLYSPVYYYIYYPNYLHVAFFYFMAGKTLYNKQLYCSIIYLSIGLLFLFPLYIKPSAIYLLMEILALLVCLYIYFYIDVLYDKRPTTNKYLRFVSQHSLHIYIVHIVAFTVLQQLTRN